MLTAPELATKFKTLYEIAFHKYKDECDRSKRIEEKVGRIFTVLNIFIVLAVTAITKNEYWSSFKNHYEPYRVCRRLFYLS